MLFSANSDLCLDKEQAMLHHHVSAVAQNLGLVRILRLHPNYPERLLKAPVCEI